MSYQLPDKYQEISGPFLDSHIGYIYHLLDENDRIVYVGQTSYIYARYASHLKSEKCFKKIRFWEVPKEKMTEIEVEQIILHNPKYNFNLPVNDKWYSLEKFLKIDRIVKGKARKIGKILLQKDWEYTWGCLELFQWQEIAKILRELEDGNGK